MSLNKEADKDKNFLSWLDSRPYYPDGLEYDSHRLYNMTILVDAPHIASHQGDISIGMLKEMRNRIVNHTLFVFNEHSDLLPELPFSLTALRVGLDQSKVKDMPYDEAADFVLKPDGTAIVNSHNWPDSAKGTAKLLEDAGWVVSKRDILPDWMTKPTKEPIRSSKRPK